MITNVLPKLLLIILQTIFCLTCLIATLPGGYYNNNLFTIPVYIVTFSIILISLVLVNLVKNSNKSKIQKFLIHNIFCSILTFVPIIGWIAIIYNFAISLFIMSVTISSISFSGDNDDNNRLDHDDELEEEQEDDYSDKLFESIKNNHSSSNQKKRKVVNKYSR